MQQVVVFLIDLQLLILLSYCVWVICGQDVHCSSQRHSCKTNRGWTDIITPVRPHHYTQLGSFSALYLLPPAPGGHGNGASLTRDQRSHGPARDPSDPVQWTGGQNVTVGSPGGRCSPWGFYIGRTADRADQNVIKGSWKLCKARTCLQAQWIIVLIGCSPCHRPGWQLLAQSSGRWVGRGCRP